jgi:hypothetical protein
LHYSVLVRSRLYAQFFYLLFKDPDRLQSERFQLTRQQYRLIGDDLRRGQVIESASEVITNPVAKAKEENSDGTKDLPPRL